VDLPKHIKEHAALGIDKQLSGISNPSPNVWRIGCASTYIEIDCNTNWITVMVNNVVKNRWKP